MKIQTDSKLIWLWRHPVRSWLTCMRSEVNSCACVTSNCILTSNEKSQPLNSCIFIVPSEGHTCPGTDRWPHAYASWPHRMMSNPQINFKAVLIFIDLAQLHFCLAYINSHWAFIDCHTPVILQLGEDKMLIYLIIIELWSNTSYFWKKYTSGPRYWNVPVLVNTGSYLVYQYCPKMWYLRFLKHANVIQKLTILEHKNGLALFNTRVPVSGTWSILFPYFLI